MSEQVIEQASEQVGGNSGAAAAAGTTLRDLKKGQKAIISGISADGEMGRRIRDMGLVPGIKIQCVGRAPLLDPVALRLMGFTLTLRNREADHISVRAVGA
jgi:ferrous iron transport protein A